MCMWIYYVLRNMSDLLEARQNKHLKPAVRLVYNNRWFWYACVDGVIVLEDSGSVTSNNFCCE